MLKVKPLPNREALAFWAEKTPLSPGQFAKLLDDEKVLAFGVSGIAKGDELETVFNALQRAIENGDTYEQFKAAAADVFERRGWTGISEWRVDNIFRTNVQTAFHVGRYRQLLDATATRPYWQYDAVNDSRTRPTHRAMHGKIFRFDHPFWDRWYPPNGFRCRCGVTSLSQREVERDGLTVSTEDPTGGLIEPTTPEGVTMPARPLMPDPGFAHSPGKTVWGGIAEASLTPGDWADVADLKTAVNVKRPALRDLADRARFAGDRIMGGGTDDALRAAFAETYGGPEILLTDASNSPVALVIDAVLQSPHRELTPLIGDIVQNPLELWLVPQREAETGRIRLARRYVDLIDFGDGPRAVAMTADTAAWIWVDGVALVDDAARIEALRRGVLIWARRF